MRILLHHRTQGRNVEGVHLREIMLAFRKLGHEVAIVGPPGTSLESEQGPAARTNAGKPRLTALVARYFPEFLFELLEMAYNLVAWYRLRQAVRRFRPDLIYERYALFLLAGVRVARSSNLPIVLEVNDSAFLPRARRLLFRGIAGRLEKRIINASDGAVYVSKRFEQRVREHMPVDCPVVICPNAVNLDYFDPSRADGEGIREKFALQDRIVCGFSGSFVPWHRVCDFLLLCADRLGEVPELALLMVGDGPEHAQAVELVERCGLGDQVFFPGRVAHEEIADYLGAMDFSVLPNSNDYGSPMKLFEFMAMRAPSLAPAVPPVVEVIADGETGWLFEPGDLGQAVNRMLELARSPAKREAVATAARRQVEARHLWTHNAAAALSLLQP